jgi:DNA-binding transcriptional LysR family regulator
MELRHLRYFVAVGDTLNFGRAALALHIAQPPLSRAIHALEDELGTTLFHRGTRGVTLTRAGAALLPEARRLLRDAEALRQNARQYAAGEAGTLAIGFVSTAAYNVLPRLVPAFRARRPGVRLALREATSDVQMPALLAGEIDVGFLIATAIPPLLAYAALHREALIAALPAKRRWPARVPLRMLAREPFILFPREVAPELHDAIVALCRRAGFAPRIGRRRSRCRRSSAWSRGAWVSRWCRPRSSTCAAMVWYTADWPSAARAWRSGSRGAPPTTRR